MIWALTALQAVVTIAWMAYGYFQPALLERFGYASLSTALGWYLVFAGSTLAPVAGAAADRILRRSGSRFPVIAAGVALAVASFVAVAITAGAEPGSARAALLPVLVGVWIAGMTIFQAPALSLVGQSAPAGDLPASMAPLVVATTLPNALWPWVVDALDRMGASTSFLAGGIAVGLTAIALGRTARVAPASPAASAPQVAPSRSAPPPPASMSATGAGAPQTSAAMLFGCGLASALVVLLALDLTPQALTLRVSSLSVTTLAAIVGIASAIGAPIAARAGTAIGSRTALFAGLIAALACRALVPACSSTLAACALAVLIGLALALHLATALPFALSSQPAARAGLAAGLYVGGAMAGSAIARVLPLG